MSPVTCAIFDRIRPSVEALFERQPRPAPDVLAPQAVRANIQASVENLRHGSELLMKLIDKGDLSVIGAEYSLETGVVEFYDALATVD